MRKLMDRYAHYNVYLIYIACVFAIVAMAIIDIWGDALWVRVTVAPLMCIGFMGPILMLMMFGTHMEKPCETCMAKMPLNGPEQAEKWDRSLAFVHWFGGPWWRGGLVSIAAISAYLASTIVTGLASPGIVILMPLVFGILNSMGRHIVVQPWCRRCRWGRGGDGKPELIPDPTPGKTVDTA